MHSEYVLRRNQLLRVTTESIGMTPQLKCMVSSSRCHKTVSIPNVWEAEIIIDGRRNYSDFHPAYNKTVPASGNTISQYKYVLSEYNVEEKKKINTEHSF